MEQLSNTCFSLSLVAQSCIYRVTLDTCNTASIRAPNIDIGLPLLVHITLYLSILKLHRGEHCTADACIKRLNQFWVTQN